jgi:hypothetical protein
MGGSAELGERLWKAAVTWMSRDLASITDRG